MHIIITLAGHSRRFRDAGYLSPKFLIEIEGRTMLEHVIDMFDESDYFHFVLNEDQANQNPYLIKWLGSLTNRNSVKVIPVHEKGPVHTALQVDSIPDFEPVIITYCDFIVNWDYRRFSRDVIGYDSAIPAFRGFHPASFGHTYYAYMRVDDENNMVELREKSSFTDRREQEYASVGIYYFTNWQLFFKYATKLMAEGFQGLKEGYVSLLANLMVADNLKIKVTDVRQFICWGTPEDLEQYLFWSQYFLVNKYKKNEEQFPSSTSARRVNLIPMAGKGSRFKDASYRASKPLISVDSQPMVVIAGHSLPSADKWIFLPRLDDLQKHPIQETLELNFPNRPIILPVDHETSGQAATCLIARESLYPNDSLLIASCDYKSIYSHEKWQAILDDSSIDAAIWTIRLGACLTKNPRAFAYCVADDGVVNKVVEKEIISDDPGRDPLVVGTFWFRRAADFILAAETAIRCDLNINGEHYIANSMNLLIQQGKRIVIFDIEQWISFGDPFELDVYYYWKDYFYNKKMLHHSSSYETNFP